jgi:stearoyl-CoA desaturase (delta-9 desaturase)
MQTREGKAGAIGGGRRATRIKRAVGLWLDTSAPNADSDADGIDWLRVLPFLGMHLACLAVQL